jgi:hypothetical protein
VIESSIRFGAFVEGYNDVSSAELSRRHGNEWRRKLGIQH